ncbi:hypothetical protein G7Y89_g4168 [Cudoniella acicularis]|uniref:Uncharacterized protein n=1 Tax=Cudoniella acicularis TaxID=354080 RepID=A0A8H4RSZ1_9HELO|nr:hypothetical protein G7Y89_g4168 [Cudoniella acicularis]
MICSSLLFPVLPFALLGCVPWPSQGYSGTNYRECLNASAADGLPPAYGMGAILSPLSSISSSVAHNSSSYILSMFYSYEKAIIHPLSQARVDYLSAEEKVIEEYGQQLLDNSPDVAGETEACRERLMIEWTDYFGLLKVDPDSV